VSSGLHLTRIFLLQSAFDEVHLPRRAAAAGSHPNRSLHNTSIISAMAAPCLARLRGTVRVPSGARE
jgi:hypothetical protein